jgi:hypothetical protein
MGVVDDRATAFLEEVRRAVEESREEAGLEQNSEATAAVLDGVLGAVEGGVAAVRESGLANTINEMTARTVVRTVNIIVVTDIKS